MAARKKARTSRAREPVDEHAATELQLYIENDYELVGADRSLGKQIEAMLLKKIKKGNFNVKASERACISWRQAQKKYAKEFSSSEKDWPRIFNKPTREQVAAIFAQDFATEHGV